MDLFKKDSGPKNTNGEWTILYDTPPGFDAPVLYLGMYREQVADVVKHCRKPLRLRKVHIKDKDKDKDIAEEYSAYVSVDEANRPIVVVTEKRNELDLLFRLNTCSVARSTRTADVEFTIDGVLTESQRKRRNERIMYFIGWIAGIVTAIATAWQACHS